MSTQFNCQKHFYLQLFSLVKVLIQTIQFSISIVLVDTQLNVKTVLFQTRKGNLKRESESLLIATENNAIKSMSKQKIDKTQQNSKCRLCGDRDETINHIISECSKLALKEYKTRHNLVGKVIHWELCKKLKFDYTNKWYIHNPESVLENKTHKLLWDFEIQTARRPDLVIANQKKKKKIELAEKWTLRFQLTTG